MNLNTFITFIDLEKFFVEINWKPLFKTRRESNEWEDKTVILRLNKVQKTLVDINGEMREELKLGRALHRDAFHVSLRMC